MSKDESGNSGSSPEAGDDLDRLLGAVARGEHGAFELVYEQLRAPIQRQVFALLRDEAQSEEVTQEVLLELWRTAVRYHADKGSAAAWAMTIARRRAIDRVRHTAASVARDQRAAISAASPVQADKAAADTDDRERLLRSLDQLSDLQREAITLAFYGGHTYNEVASILDTPLGTVKSRIRDALIKLRDGIRTEEPGLSGPTCSRTRSHHSSTSPTHRENPARDAGLRAARAAVPLPGIAGGPGVLVAATGDPPRSCGHHPSLHLHGNPRA